MANGTLVPGIHEAEDGGDILHSEAVEFMREIIPTRLWIGNAMDARNVTGVLGLGVSAIVDLAIEEPPIQFPRDVVYCRFPLIDGVGNQPTVLRVAIDTGRMPAPIRIGRAVRWGYDELRAWVAAGCPQKDLWKWPR